uniref:ROK family protein n=1 Tax=Eubacterium plexicaudatum ASF492 TaxID=1235802 RepID=N1ZXK4_9FIRM
MSKMTKEGLLKYNMKKYVCIDIGGTAVKYGLIGADGMIISRGETPTEAEKGGPSILEKAVTITDRFTQEHEIAGICVSTAGIVDTKKGMIRHAAPLIPQYTGTRIKETMEQRFSVPCEVENDVNCAGLAEYLTGAGKDSDPMLMLTIGTGIGGCMVTGGHVFHGVSYSACEVGYMHMRGSDFQTLGSAGSLVKKTAERKQEPVEDWNGFRIFSEAKLGNSVCIETIDELTDVLGLGIANLCYVLNPETVVLGGGIMAQEDYLADRIRTALDTYLIDSIATHVTIRFAKHRNDAGMLGAFYHFKGCHLS